METLVLLGVAAIIAYFVGRASAEPKITRARAETKKVEEQLREVQGLFDGALRGVREDERSPDPLP